MREPTISYQIIAVFSCFFDGIPVGILKEFRYHLQNSDRSEVEKYRILSFRGLVSYLFGVFRLLWSEFCRWEQNSSRIPTRILLEKQLNSSTCLRVILRPIHFPITYSSMPYAMQSHYT